MPLSNATEITDYINEKMGKAAERLGKSFSVKRSSSSASPVTVGSLLCSFTPEDYKYGKAANYGENAWFGILNASTVNVGDYLVGNEGTWFVASKGTHLPLLCTRCTTTISCSKPILNPNTNTANTELFSGWGASVMANSPASGGLDLPGSIGQGEFKILLPIVPGVEIKTGYSIIDTALNKYTIKTVEVTHLGYRLWVNRVKG